MHAVFGYHKKLNILKYDIRAISKNQTHHISIRRGKVFFHHHG
jgi:hypothetical protein